MDGYICIDGLMVECVIGCLPEERLKTRSLQVDLEVGLDLSGLSGNDRIEETWDYRVLAELVTGVLQEGRFHLLEHAAQAILRVLMVAPGACDARPAAKRARVALTKFGVLPGGARARVVLEV